MGEKERKSQVEHGHGRVQKQKNRQEMPGTGLKAKKKTDGEGWTNGHKKVLPSSQLGDETATLTTMKRASMEG
jgi:hypothetical protein